MIYLPHLLSCDKLRTTAEEHSDILSASVDRGDGRGNWGRWLRRWVRWSERAVGQAVVPRHPTLWIRGEFLRVMLEFGQVVEGIGAAQLAGVRKDPVDVTRTGILRPT